VRGLTLEVFILWHDAGARTAAELGLWAKFIAIARGVAALVIMKLEIHLF